MDKRWLHSDYNSFFASVEMLENPALNNVPMVVACKEGARSNVVLSKNDLAKKLGILTGESIARAQRKVVGVQVIYSDYHKYIDYAVAAREIYNNYGSEVIPFGTDEAWVDVSDITSDLDNAKELADHIRQKIFATTKLTVSVGVSYNLIFAKLASDYKKPDATTLFAPEHKESLVWQLPVEKLLFIGQSTKKKLYNLNIHTIGDLANYEPVIIDHELKLPGLKLWFYANGDDHCFDPRELNDVPYKTIGNTITPNVSFFDDKQILLLAYGIIKGTCARLKKREAKSKTIVLELKYDGYDSVHKQITLQHPTNNECILFEYYLKIYKEQHVKGLPVRSVGVHLANLQYNDNQILLTDMPEKPNPDIKKITDQFDVVLKKYDFTKAAAADNIFKIM